MGTSKNICKVKNCLGGITHRAVIVVKPFQGGAFPMILETPLTVCVNHRDDATARTLQTKENFDVIADILKDQGMKLEKKQLEVHFVRLADRPEEGQGAHAPSAPVPESKV